MQLVSTSKTAKRKQILMSKQYVPIEIPERPDSCPLCTVQTRHLVICLTCRKTFCSTCYDKHLRRCTQQYPPKSKKPQKQLQKRSMIGLSTPARPIIAWRPTKR